MFSMLSMMRLVGVEAEEDLGEREEVSRETVGRWPPGKMYLRMKSVEEA